MNVKKYFQTIDNEITKYTKLLEQTKPEEVVDIFISDHPLIEIHDSISIIKGIKENTINGENFFDIIKQKFDIPKEQLPLLSDNDTLTKIVDYIACGVNLPYAITLLNKELLKVDITTTKETISTLVLTNPEGPITGITTDDHNLAYFALTNSNSLLGYIITREGMMEIKTNEEGIGTLTSKNGIEDIIKTDIALYKEEDIIQKLVHIALRTYKITVVMSASDVLYGIKMTQTENTVNTHNDLVKSLRIK